MKHTFRRMAQKLQSALHLFRVVALSLLCLPCFQLSGLSKQESANSYVTYDWSVPVAHDVASVLLIEIDMI